MRAVYVMAPDYKVKEIYEVKDFKRALEDIESCGWTVIDLKFDMNGDILILCACKEMYV